MGNIREDLEAAFEGEDDNYDETPQEILTDETEEVSEIQADAIVDDVETIDTSEAETETEETVQASTDESVEVEETKLTGDSIKAPVNWGPQEREHWSKVPRNLQEKIIARETEMTATMQNTSDARRTHQDFTGLIQQYGSVLSGVMGDTPMETTKNLFSTVANLRMGSPIQKAQIIADMITDFDVDINTLDSAIVGAAPSAENQQTNQLDQMLKERLAPFEQMMGQQNAYQEQQATQRTEAANSEVAEFSKTAEFMNDVRNDMADLIDMAAKRGQDMSMQDAYSKACSLNPQIVDIMQKRHQTAQLTGQKTTLASKHLAASSVNGARIGNGEGGGNLSMHDTLSAAWDNQNSI